MLAKADRIDGGGGIEGYLVDDVIVPISFKYFKDSEKINPQTLKYSFDNGKSWFSKREIREKLKGL